MKQLAVSNVIICDCKDHLLSELKMEEEMDAVAKMRRTALVSIYEASLQCLHFLDDSD